MQPKSNRSRPESDYEREARNRRDAQIVVTRCGLCETIRESTFVDGRAWHVLHLREEHPDFEPKVLTPATRRRASGPRRKNPDLARS